MANLLKLANSIEKRNPEYKPSGNFLSSDFGKMVFAYRIRAGLSQVKLAELADVSPSTIHRIEGGSGGITDHNYAKVFKVLGIDKKEIVDFFLGNEPINERELVPSK